MTNENKIDYTIYNLNNTLYFYVSNCKFVNSNTTMYISGVYTG